MCLPRPLDNDTCRQVGQIAKRFSHSELFTIGARVVPQTRGAQRRPLHVELFLKFLVACVLGSILHGIDVICQDLVPVKPPPSNERSGVDIDRYVGDPLKSPPGRTHEAIIKRAILTHGSPLASGGNRAVLEYRKELTLGTLGPKDLTPLVDLDLQLFFFVASGEGRIDDGLGYWDLREGVGVLVPPRLKHRITNTSDEPLELLMLTWEPPAGVPWRSRSWCGTRIRCP